MNVALPALVIFLLLLPGFIVRSRFKRAELISLDYSPFGQVVTEAVLWGGVCHALWLFIANLCFDQTLDVAVLIKLLSADLPGQSKAADAVAASSFLIAMYFGTLFLGAYAIPTLTRRWVTKHRLDRHDAKFSSLFRFHQAPWYYLLTGADFEENEKPDLIAISAVVNMAGEPVLYKGILDEFFVGSDGTLDRLVLQQVMRRPLEKDKSPSTEDGDLSRFYVVDGDYFVLRYSEAITLNIEYIKLVFDEESEPQPDLL